MPLVLDASVAACWAFDDEDHPAAHLSLQRVRTDKARVPALWWCEVRNIMVVNERRGRIADDDTALFPRGLARLGVSIDRLVFGSTSTSALPSRSTRVSGRM
jgi:predicted nucleic acid-binding protein